MARKTQPHDVIALHFDGLIGSVRKLLIKNRNFKTSEDGPHNRREAFYFREYPRTQDFVRGVLKGQAEFIIEKIEELKTLAIDFTDIKQISDEELAAEVSRRKGEALAQPPRREEGVDETIAKYAKFINDRPMLVSLLYDINMLPEQCVTLAGAIRLAGLCEVWKKGESGKLLGDGATGHSAAASAGGVDAEALATAAADEVRRSYSFLNADELALTVSSAVTMRAKALARAIPPDITPIESFTQENAA